MFKQIVKMPILKRGIMTSQLSLLHTFSTSKPSFLNAPLVKNVQSIKIPNVLVNKRFFNSSNTDINPGAVIREDIHNFIEKRGRQIITLLCILGIIYIWSDVDFDHSNVDIENYVSEYNYYIYHKYYNSIAKELYDAGYVDKDCLAPYPSLYYEALFLNTKSVLHGKLLSYFREDWSPLLKQAVLSVNNPTDSDFYKSPEWIARFPVVTMYKKALLNLVSMKLLDRDEGPANELITHLFTNLINNLGGLPKDSEGYSFTRWNEIQVLEQILPKTEKSNQIIANCYGHLGDAVQQYIVGLKAIEKDLINFTEPRSLFKVDTNRNPIVDSENAFYGPLIEFYHIILVSQNAYEKRKSIVDKSQTDLLNKSTKAKKTE